MALARLLTACETEVATATSSWPAPIELGEEVARLFQLLHPQFPGRAKLFPVVKILLVGLAHVEGKGALGATVEKHLGLQDGKALALLHDRNFLGLFDFT